MATVAATDRSRRAVVLAVLAGALASLAIGIYGRTASPTDRELLLGFNSLIAAKFWLTAVTGLLVTLQLLTAMWMYGRLGLRAPTHLGAVHRGIGAVALLVSLPVAYNCLFVIGFGSTDARVLLHSVVGCLVYGAFVAKVVGLQAPEAPSWLVTVAGGMLFTLLVLAVLTSAVWYLGAHGMPGLG
ncbi:MAG: hypothetical protein HOQ22_11455 [Nocardioidaceae bacterium]|nr:hypothetical protein [Nocardioidaceae bacterium]NUS51642.1 hypothetical protein [Nocardioidaceae bacterium]